GLADTAYSLLSGIAMPPIAIAVAMPPLARFETWFTCPTVAPSLDAMPGAMFVSRLPPSETVLGWSATVLLPIATEFVANACAPWPIATELSPEATAPWPPPTAVELSPVARAACPRAREPAPEAVAAWPKAEASLP